MTGTDRFDEVAERIGPGAARDVSLAARTTYRVGGRAAVLVEVVDDDHLRRVAAVVADTEGAAEEGCRRLRVTYDVLPAVLDPEAAMAPGAPVVHGGNVAARLHDELGDVAAGLSEADVVYEATFRTPRVQHAALETLGAVGWLEDDRLVLRSSTQTPY
ncbi:MAG: molybdopterin-dependent oxidoreductase, partial [Actinomycetota bacterium]|nr:molybdopterin-dependent oxidoreductase [Actinomycetota bacterium]